MKNIFKIHSITYLILASVLLCGYFNYFLIIAFILICHDFGHLILIKLFNYKINNILILPFGSIINTNINLNSRTKEIFLISIAGIAAQFLLYPLMGVLNASLINQSSYQIFLKFNHLLILFNLLPIIPLDGSKILLCILESFLSYKKSLKLVNLTSVLGILIFLWYLTFYSFNSYLIVTFLIYKTYETIKQHHHIFNHFLLTRHLKKKNYQHIKHISSIKNIYKNKYNFIKNQNEDKALDNYFKV